MKVVIIDTDIFGSESVSHLIQSGHVQAFKCGTLKAVEGVIKSIRRKELECDMIMLDTITGLVQRLQKSLVFGKFASQPSVWDMREKVVDNWDTYRGIGNWANFICDLLYTVYEELGIPNIIISHEKSTKKQESRSDPLTGDDKTIPDLQEGINKTLYAFSDAIVRLTLAPAPFLYQGVTWPRHTRILVLKPDGDPTGQSSAGLRVNPTIDIPSFMVVPDIHQDPYGFARFVQVIGRVPASTFLYGTQKIGKTTYACGAVYL